MMFLVGLEMWAWVCRLTWRRRGVEEEEEGEEEGGGGGGFGTRSFRLVRKLTVGLGSGLAALDAPAHLLEAPAGSASPCPARPCPATLTLPTYLCPPKPILPCMHQCPSFPHTHCS